MLTAENARQSANRAFQRHGVYAISVEGVLVGTIADACRNSRRIGDLYARIRLSTVGRVRADGFVLLATFARPHFSVLLPDVSEPTLTRLDACFDPPIANPAAPPQG